MTASDVTLATERGGVVSFGEADINVRVIWIVALLFSEQKP
jgi:hypothetical protein